MSQLNKYSSRITQPKSQGASQAMLYATGMTDAGHEQAAGRYCERLVRRQSLQYASAHAGRQSERGRRGGRDGRHAVQHHWRQRRYFDGHRRDELLAPVARSHRRFDRDGDGESVVRREYLASRVRQEHARLRDGDGPAQSAVADGVRRHDPGRPWGPQREARRRLGVSVLRPVPVWRDRRRAAGSGLSGTRVQGRAPAAACTRRTPWLRRSRRSG